MKVIYKGRGKGKTTELIKIASENNYYIIVGTHERAQEVARMAKNMNLHILFPVTVDEYMRSQFKGSHVKNVVIDDADFVLQKLFNQVQIEAITITKTEEGEIKWEM